MTFSSYQLGVGSGEFCHCNSIATVQDAVTKLHKGGVKIKIKAKIEDKCGLSRGTGSRGAGSGEKAIAPHLYFTPLARNADQIATSGIVFSS